MNSLVDVGTKRCHRDHSQQSERLLWSRARYKAPITIGNSYVLSTLAKKADFDRLCTKYVDVWSLLCALYP